MAKGKKVKEFFVRVCIVITLIITCCCCEQHLNVPGIVTGVKVIDSNFGYAKDKKYRITVGQEFNTRYKTSCYVYTNKLYQVGDTITIR